MERSEWKIIADEINAVLAKHGYEVTRRTGHYGATDGDFKFNVASLDPKAVAKRSDDKEDGLRSYLKFHGVDVSDSPLIGRSVRATNGRRYTIVGFKPQNRSYPIIIEGPQGGQYKVAYNQLKWD